MFWVFGCLAAVWVFRMFVTNCVGLVYGDLVVCISVVCGLWFCVAWLCWDAVSSGFGFGC